MSQDDSGYGGESGSSLAGQTGEGGWSMFSGGTSAAKQPIYGDATPQGGSGGYTPPTPTPAAAATAAATPAAASPLKLSTVLVALSISAVLAVAFFAAPKK